MVGRWMLGWYTVTYVTPPHLQTILRTRHQIIDSLSVSLSCFVSLSLSLSLSHAHLTHAHTQTHPRVVVQWMQNITTNITNTVAVIVKNRETTNDRFFKMLTMMEAKLDKLEPSFPEKHFRTSSGAHVHLEQAGDGADAPVEADDVSMTGEICTLCHFVMVPRRSSHLCVLH